MQMMAWLYALLASRPVVWLLLFVNAAGTIYGYYWYRYQLADTPPVFLPFVPDSPTASLFFSCRPCGMAFRQVGAAF
ncbi:putative membrane spanning protein [Geobacillus sp. WSUCF1]|nr:putative membrane spanning protein [Geobacillus sp. WSUCF1]